MFIAALFIIARSWKQPRCPSADEWIRNLWYIYTMEYYSAIKKDEWIRKLWYIYTMEYYSAVKKNTFESVLIRWMKLELIYRVK